MADREEEEDLQMALRMSLQGSLPEPKRSKPFEEESRETREKRLQRELRAAAAEKRISMLRKSAATTAVPVTSPVLVEDRSCRSIGKVENSGFDGGRAVSLGDGEVNQADEKRERKDGGLGEELSLEVANQLFSMLFGNDVSSSILSQWTNQGIRFSSDPDTCIGLVQHEGGPCGVLAAIQAFVLKYLLFSPQNLNTDTSQANFSQRRFLQNPRDVFDNFTRISEDQKSRALICSMVEILFSCGSKKRVAIATLNIFGDYSPVESEGSQKDKMLSEALEGFSIQSAADLRKTLRVTLYTSEASAFHQLMMDIPVFHSRMGAILFLISALLSRGLDSLQADRDDPSLPLVTAPFGHASQEIVNLLLCGRAAPNVFDDNMDLGGGMFLKGIPGPVEVGFLTLLESLNFCKVGGYLKCPTWPIWVVGSESHYTVLFALDTSVQNENELEERESKIRRTFNDEDQSGGGGFISVEAFHKVLRETGIHLPQDKLDNLCGAGYIVWTDFWHVLLDLDKSLGGLKDTNGLGKKEFVAYHFNGIAKSVSNGNQISSGETLIQRPRLCKLSVSVPPRWTQEEFMADVANSSNNEPQTKEGSTTEIIQLPEQPQQAPLVDCIRTRWPRAVCHWAGDPPSIV